MLEYFTRNKYLLYDRHVLSKISWHLTVADLGKTWLSENLHTIARKHVHQWLDLSIFATISSVFFLTKTWTGPWVTFYSVLPIELIELEH